jgi:hypothetical protein
MWLFTWIQRLVQRMMQWEPPKIEQKKLYEQSYPLDTPKETIEESIDHLMNKRVEEKTPDGNVILSYEESSNTFLYWAQKPIAYRYLEVVARKYVILYDCKSNYVNMFTELLKAMKQSDKKVSDSPFVVYKSYNTVAHKIDNRKLANENGNHYKHMGKELPTEVVCTVKPITFAEYKKNTV